MRAVYVQTGAYNTFTHDWTNVCAAAIRSDMVGADAGEEFGNLLEVRTRLRRCARGETQTFWSIDA
jgi:hypothetical protein